MRNFLLFITRNLINNMKKQFYLLLNLRVLICLVKTVHQTVLMFRRGPSLLSGDDRSIRVMY